MSFAGHAFDAIKRVQYNRAIKQMHKSRYNKLKEAIRNTQTKYHDFRDKSQLTPEELIKYKKQIKASIVKERWIVIIKSLSATAIIAVLIIYISKFLYNLFINSF